MQCYGTDGVHSNQRSREPGYIASHAARMIRDGAEGGKGVMYLLRFKNLDFHKGESDFKPWVYCFLRATLGGEK
jgi:hypothetical protein